ncbi:MAG TPA: magnesium transporter [Methylophaga aminisulfidivorans]|jgi:magnesium transporter|uniref:Magnesium transporter MgtE n=1 Tax=Methylophaga aminisulfidivorans MP TaxID=1026882 RepID=F5T195_9GAMM|nr:MULTISPECIES: magnesium transporter [Methylophaga]EGL53799.1 mg/Co/Ni transporter MgtE [Methylophaga aminisulfidivorans MP]HIC45880.1 magnesium transporter [Methylophaga sp.]HIM38472.1 magnesium transporter [Methylophaga aminisulfidivorans]
MSELDHDHALNQSINALSDALQSGRFVRMRRLLAGLHPAETAHLLESLPPNERKICWPLINPDLRGEVLSYIGEEVRTDLMTDMDTADLINATEDLDADDIADILQDLPDHVVHEVLRAMDIQHRRRVEAVLAYDEESAGGLMNTDVTTVRTDITLEVVLRYLRMLGELPENTDSLYVVDHNDHYLGTLRLSQVVSRNRSLLVSEVMSHQVDPIPANMTDRDVARRFEKHDLISAPVVDKDNRLLGRITIDDVVDVIRDDAEHSMLSMAGLGEDEDTFATVKRSVHRRSVWLAVNLLTAFLASWVIGLFETTIQKQVALAVLMPIVASMGGIAGSQTLTLVIRSMALGQLNSNNERWLLRKEMLVGATNGLIWATAIAIVTVIWFNSVSLGLLIGTAIIINLVAAALAGVTIPLGLKRIGIDPALSGSVLLTTVTDVVGFMAFLGFAKLFIV